MLGEAPAKGSVTANDTSIRPRTLGSKRGTDIGTFLFFSGISMNNREWERVFIDSESMPTAVPNSPRP